MGKPALAWAADIDVPDSLAASLVAEQFADLRHLPVRRFGEGWDNVVFSVGHEWLLRLPRRKRAVEGVEREMRCLPLIAPFLPVEVPLPTLHGAATLPYPWPFFAYRKLPGAEACDLRLQDNQRVRLAAPLAQSLRSLHRSTGLGVIRDSLPYDLRRIDSDYRRSWGRARLLELSDAGEDLPYEQLTDCLAAAGAIACTGPATVVHGDLHFRHLLVQTDGELSGIIDWGKIHRGDPAIDLQIYWSFFPSEGREIFLQEYGEVEKYQLSLARAVAVWLNAVLLQYARHEGLYLVAEEARRALRNTIL